MRRDKCILCVCVGPRCEARWPRPTGVPACVYQHWHCDDS